VLLDRYAQNSIVKYGNIEFKYTCTTKTCGNNVVHGKLCALFLSVKFESIIIIIIIIRYGCLLSQAFSSWYFS
jgi:hypothetical protein